MKYGIRALAWVLTAFATIPPLMAGADTAERGQGGDFFRIPPLMAGETYVYDAFFESTSHDLQDHVPAYLTVEVGHPMVRPLPDGTEGRTVTLTFTRLHGSWDDITRATYLEDWRTENATTREVRTIDLDRGLLVAIHTDAQTVRWRPADPGVDLATTHTVQVEQPRVVRTPFDWGMAPGQRLINPAAWWVHATKSLYRAEIPTALKGDLDGRTVYDVMTWGRPEERMTVGTIIACNLHFPETQYYDFDLTRQIEGRLLWERAGEHAWVSPDTALPVLQTCEHVVRLGGRNGEPIEDVRLALALSKHSPGAVAIDVRLDHYERAIQTGGFGAIQGPWPGVPATGAPALPFPLADAVESLRGSADPNISSFFRQDGVALTSAHYQGWPEEPRKPATRPPPEISQVLEDAGLAGSSDEPAARPQWRMTFVAGNAEMFIGTSRRTMTADGRTLDEVVEGAPLDVQSPTLAGASLGALVPMGDLAGRFAADVGADPAQWLLDPGASIDVGWEQMDLSFEPASGYTYTFRLGAPTAFPDTEDYRLRKYSASDGFLVQDSQTVSQQSSAPSAPRARAAAQAAAPTVEPVTIGWWAVLTGLVVGVLWAVVYFAQGALRIAAMGAFGLYAKILKQDVLSHERRDAIVALIAATPGLDQSAIRRRLGIGHGALLHHLGTLQRNGLATSVRVGRTRRWFLPGQLPASERAAYALLQSKAVHRLWDVIHEEPGLTQAEIARRAGVSGPTSRFHLRRMVRHGAVEQRPGGPHAAYFARTLQASLTPIEAQTPSPQPVTVAA